MLLILMTLAAMLGASHAEDSYILGPFVPAGQENSAITYFYTMDSESKVTSVIIYKGQCMEQASDHVKFRCKDNNMIMNFYQSNSCENNPTGGEPVEVTTWKDVEVFDEFFSPSTSYHLFGTCSPPGLLKLDGLDKLTVGYKMYNYPCSSGVSMNNYPESAEVYFSPSAKVKLPLYFGGLLQLGDEDNQLRLYPDFTESYTNYSASTQNIEKCIETSVVPGKLSFVPTRVTVENAIRATAPAANAPTPKYMVDADASTSNRAAFLACLVLWCVFFAASAGGFITHAYTRKTGGDHGKSKKM